eukprot:c22052_g1_i1 orf=516-1757(+)
MQASLKISGCHGCALMESGITAGIASSCFGEPLTSRPLQANQSRIFHCANSLPWFSSSNRTLSRTRQGHRRFHIHALQKGSSDGFDDNLNIGKATDIPGLKIAEVSALENGAWMHGQRMTVVEQNDPLWEQVGTGLRTTYAIGVYGAMVLVGQITCHFTGIDNVGGFNLSADVALQGLGYAVPPMMALLFILDDEIVKKSLPARAIRDVEDEELMSFFVGLSLWQVTFVVTMAAVAEEFFFRVAIQGGLTHIFLSDDKTREPIDGIAALTGVFPSLAPFAQALAAILTAALTGSILFITSFPQDPKYVVAPARGSRASLRNLKQSFAAWYERRQLRRIYSPLLESLLALYIGFEWMQTGNILAPIITHVIYSSVIIGNGVRRIHDQRYKLRQRTQCLWEKNLTTSDSCSEKNV